VCKLCGRERPLENSHYPFPAFIFRWMKRTGGSFFRRPGHNPNIPYQDGLQMRLLCGDCEDLFQADEDRFSKRIFEPIVRGHYDPLPYEQFLVRFLLSVLWRHLSLSLSGPDPGMGRFRELFISAEEEWRRFLLRAGELRRFGRIHLFITDLSASEHNKYLVRTVDSTIVLSGSGRCGVYAKFARFIVFAELSDDFDPAQWVNTRISIGSGVLLKDMPQVIGDASFGSFLRERARIATRLMRNASPAQRAKIAAQSRADAARIRDTDLGRVLAADAIVRASVPKVGRNEPCPCGSGRKYKTCHGA
jgi:SEC-C motif